MSPFVRLLKVEMDSEKASTRFDQMLKHEQSPTSVQLLTLMGGYTAAGARTRFYDKAFEHVLERCGWSRAEILAYRKWKRARAPVEGEKTTKRGR